MNDIRIFPELVKSDPHAPIIPNIDPEKGSLGEHSIHPTPQDPQKHAVRIFIEFLQNTYEGDYGDFMREVNAHLIDLEAQFAKSETDSLNLIHEMQDYVQFRPNWEIEPTRERLLKDVQKFFTAS